MAREEPTKLALDEDVRRLLAPLLRERGWDAIYFPFGGGARICIGAALATILERFELLPASPTEKLEVTTPAMTLRPRRAVKMIVRPV